MSKRSYQEYLLLERSETKLAVNFITFFCIIAGVFLGIYNFTIYHRCDKTTATITDIRVETREEYNERRKQFETKEINHYYISYSYKFKREIFPDDYYMKEEYRKRRNR